MIAAPRAPRLDAFTGIGVGLGAAFEIIAGDPFAWFALILALTNLADWIFGRHAARARIDPETGKSEFSRTKSRNGLVGKLIVLTIVGVLRLVEYALPLSGIPTTGGLISSAFALGLIFEDIESLERHAIQLTGKEIPGLSKALNALRSLTGGERRGAPPVDPVDTPQRRRTDPEPTRPATLREEGPGP